MPELFLLNYILELCPWATLRIIRRNSPEKFITLFTVRISFEDVVLSIAQWVPRGNSQEKCIFKVGTKNSIFFLPEQVVVGLMDIESYKNYCFPVYNGDLKIWGSSTEYHCFFHLVSLQGFFLMLIIHHQNAFIYSVLFDFVNHLKSSLEKLERIVLEFS